VFRRLSTLRRYRDGLLQLVRSPGGRPPKPEVQPPEAPPGWSVGPPDFVGVGSARSGTTWWDELIHAHPDVVRAPGVPKEVHYFDRFWGGTFGDGDVARYRRFFPRPRGKVAGEWTPGYALDFWTPPLLRRAAPDARLLILLRDPVERFRSGLTLTENRLTLNWTPRASANGGFQRGVYADQLLRVWAAFPREQVLVLQFEQCVRDPRSQLRRTFNFLGLDEAAADGIDVARRVNETRVRKVPMSDWQRQLLVERYTPENARLAELVPDLDLSLWQPVPGLRPPSGDPFAAEAHTTSAGAAA
jgi:hypothetical protein